MPAHRDDQSSNLAFSAVTGAVLIGGQSRRMGEPKALIRLYPDGPTLLERAVNALSGVAAEVMLVGRSDWSLPTTLEHLRRVPDGGQGAADGLVASLYAADTDLCVVVGCDMPFLDAELLRRMARQASRSLHGVVAVDERGAHPLHAVYRTRERDVIEGRIAAGERSLTALVGSLGMEEMYIGRGETEASFAWSVFNVNTPHDLAIARCHEAADAAGT